MSSTFPTTLSLHCCRKLFSTAINLLLLIPWATVSVLPAAVSSIPARGVNNWGDAFVQQCRARPRRWNDFRVSGGEPRREHHDRGHYRRVRIAEKVPVSRDKRPSQRREPQWSDRPNLSTRLRQCAQRRVGKSEKELLRNAPSYVAPVQFANTLLDVLDRGTPIATSSAERPEKVVSGDIKSVADAINYVVPATANRQIN